MSGPKGYNTLWAAMQDLLRFGPAIFSGDSGGANRFLVFLFHATTTTLAGCESDQHSGEQAVTGIYSAKHGRWKHGGAGVSLSTYRRETKRLIEQGFVRCEQRSSFGKILPNEYSVDWLSFRAAVEAWEATNDARVRGGVR